MASDSQLRSNTDYFRGGPLFDRVYGSIVKRESVYDGLFYTGVRTTKIVCRPSCRARTPKKENITLYTSYEAAVKAGFRPCKRCRPESPGPNGPDAALAAQVDAWIDAQPGEPWTLRALAERLAISPYHLQRTYKRVNGRSPLDYRQAARLKMALKLLKGGELPIAEIGASVGFRSASHFAVWFRRETGLSPQEYREREAEKGDA